MRDRLIELIEQKQIYGIDQDQPNKRDIQLFDNEELADHLLANGVIVPPVRVGQWVYVLSRGKIVPMMVCSILIGTFENYIKVEAEEEYGYWRLDIPFHNSTIDWYLTREEAERALVERRADNG